MMKLGDVLADKLGVDEAPRQRFWMGEVPGFDDFGNPIEKEFVDGKTRFGPWAFMTPAAFSSNGLGRLGTGFGQRYEKQANGRWLKVEG